MPIPTPDHPIISLDILAPVGADFDGARRRDALESLDRVLVGRAPHYVSHMLRQMAQNKADLVPRTAQGGFGADLARLVDEAPLDRLFRVTAGDVEHGVHGDRLRITITMIPPAAFVRAWAATDTAARADFRDNAWKGKVAGWLLDTVEGWVIKHDGPEEAAQAFARVNTKAHERSENEAKMAWGAAMVDTVVQDLPRWARHNRWPLAATTVTGSVARAAPLKTLSLQDVVDAVDTPTAPMEPVGGRTRQHTTVDRLLAHAPDAEPIALAVPKRGPR